jgi:pyridoxal phosphate enzyme (YggS family)
MTMISANLHHVHARIAAACQAAGRGVEEVTLLAVSKTFGPDAVQQAFGTGQTAFGENYIQEGVEKILAIRAWETQCQAACPSQWHCIGPVQSNKTRLVAEHFDWIQSVDRLKIAQRLSEQRPAHLPPLQVCIQVNIDGGTTKAGVVPEQALALAREVAVLPRLQLRGLMCIPEPAPSFVAACALFARARTLFDQIVLADLPESSDFDPQAFDTLSMGMTADLEAAIHAGSTMVRVGTAIFGGR